MRNRLLEAFFLVALLAGCASPATDDPTTAGAGPAGTDEDGAAPTTPSTMTILGLVQDAALVPVAGANVSLRFTQHAATTDAGGLFRFDGLEPSAYVVDVSAPGFDNTSLTAEPGSASLNFVLEQAASLKPLQVTTVFHGFIECALEILIITPSCDSAVTFVPGAPGAFNTTSTFTQDLQSGWATLVVDVDFDPDANPGLDGMRLSVRGRSDSEQLGTYEQYGRFYGPAAFTARLDPGQTYEEGDGPVPNNATSLELDVYPQSLLWHTVCVPFCTLGVGAGMNVEFDVYVTAFYNQPAPDGWSFLATPA